MSAQACLLGLGVAAALSGCATFGTNIKGSFACAAPEGICAPSSVIDDRALAMISGETPRTTPAVDRTRPDATERGPVVASRSLKIVLPARTDARGVLHETRVVRALVTDRAWATSLAAGVPETVVPGVIRIEPAAADAIAAKAIDPDVPAPSVVAAARARANPKKPVSAPPAPTTNPPAAFVAKVDD